MIRKKLLSEKSNDLRIIIPKSVIKKAVARNLLRRRIRAVIRTHYPHEYTSLIVFIKQGALSLSFQELTRACCDAVDNLTQSKVH